MQVNHLDSIVWDKQDLEQHTSSSSMADQKLQQKINLIASLLNVPSISYSDPKWQAAHVQIQAHEHLDTLEYEGYLAKLDLQHLEKLEQAATGIFALYNVQDITQKKRIIKSLLSISTSTIEYKKIMQKVIELLPMDLKGENEVVQASDCVNVVEGLCDLFASEADNQKFEKHVKEIKVSTKEFRRTTSQIKPYLVSFHIFQQCQERLKKS